MVLPIAPRRGLVSPSRAMRPCLLFSLVFVGCHASGTWVDDPANWRRAFGQAIPEGVHLERSWYWRSPHFTREEAYFFAFAAPAEVEESLRRENKMQIVLTDQAAAVRDKSCFERPDWFPEPGVDFDVWVAEHGALLRHRPSSMLYLTVCQL